ncbi:hypothetical protein HAX54_003827 [Datura stramonium]|uniref:Uncharacterized protein n=1 Tax=Datura stramonium TaxID=4076 RepID=A0ABS8WV27_DATST|nr:hypothetical protein [Datura stramonium]
MAVVMVLTQLCYHGVVWFIMGEERKWLRAKNQDFGISERRWKVAGRELGQPQIEICELHVQRMCNSDAPVHCMSNACAIRMHQFAARDLCYRCVPQVRCIRSTLLL